MQTIQVTRKQDIPIGKMKGFSVAGKQILIANVAESFYAMDALCAHMGGYLPDGKLEKNVITCPVHHAQYDVITGKFLLSTSSLLDLNTYEVVVEEDKIKIKL